MIELDENKKYRAGAYLRLSKEDGDKEESDSIMNQRELIRRRMAEYSNVELCEEYVDDGFSGTSDDRPDLQRLLNDIKSKKIDCVIVKDLSRFARDYLFTGKLIEEEVESGNVRFIAMLDGYDSATSDESLWDILLPIRNIMNEYYSKDLSRKIKSSFNTKRKNGEFIGAYACYGYTKDGNQLVVDDFAANIVKDIFEMYLNGINLTQIANRLNQSNVLSPSEYKKRCEKNYKCGNQILKQSVWTRSVISEMLRNETYIGNLVQGKTTQGIRKKKKRTPKSEWIIVKNTHQPIIMKDRFDRVQEMLSRNIRCTKKTDNGVHAIFSGFVRCGDCGMALTQRIQKGKYISYACANYTRYGHVSCSSHHITQKKLTEIVLNDLNCVIANVKNLSEMVQQEKKELSAPKRRCKIQDFEKEIEKREKHIEKAYLDYQQNVITLERYRRYVERWDNEIKLLKKKIDMFRSEEQKIIDFENVPWILNFLKIKKVESLSRDIVYEMVDTITIYENKTIVIRYKFSDELEKMLDLYGE